MDARRRKELDPRWQSFMEHTSMLPFEAVADGRQKLRSSEFDWRVLAVGMSVYALVYFFHDWVSGGISLL